jgi:hypothetical protein
MLYALTITCSHTSTLCYVPYITRLDFMTQTRITASHHSSQCSYSHHHSVSLSPSQCITLTVSGFVESLNLSAASAVLCAVLESKEALKPDLTPGEKKRVSLTWMARTVTGSMAVLRQGAGLNVKGTMLYNKIGEFTTRP